MDLKDFGKDFREFRRKVGEQRSEVNQAKQRLETLFERWSETIEEWLPGIMQVTSVPQNSRLEGKVLGKHFSINYAPICADGSGALEAVLCIRDLVTGDPLEVGRFLVTAEGLILSLDGAELADLKTRDDDLNVLTAVASRVINSRSKA